MVEVRKGDLLGDGRLTVVRLKGKFSLSMTKVEAGQLEATARSKAVPSGGMRKRLKRHQKRIKTGIKVSRIVQA